MEILLSKIGEIVEGKLSGGHNKIICGAAPFDMATQDDITFADSSKFLKKIDKTDAGAVIVPKDFAESSKTTVMVENPRVAFSKVLTLFYPHEKPVYLNSSAGISSNAYTGKNFLYGKDISIAPFVVIQNNVTIGDRVVIHPNTVIGDNVVIGDDVEIYPNVTILERCRIGNRVIIHAGTVIGSDGFGFAPDGESYFKIPQTGIVQIDDDVEIGANNTIDRATFGKTRICRGVKVDNLVHIAHNVTVGEDSIIVAQVGISGSVTIGRHAVLAGQAGIAGHITLGDNVTIGPQAGVAASVQSDQVMSGTPEMPHKLWLRVQRLIYRLPELKKKLSEIEKRLNRIEQDTLIL
ncbi:MAG: UDP-3-O-(3-hydroxymyristoyl)glucosamine N-acyltransferase [Desulfobacterales bacterium]|nr:UDP-3-O-(3-hydroxymyristoyl)glucosamine N-acyltransferase [Desulfobacterales bacterium]